MPKLVKTFLALLFAVFSILFAIMVFSGGALFWHHRFGGANDDLLKNEMTFYASQGYRVGQYLKKLEPDRQLLLLADPDYQRNENVKQLAYSMIEGYGSNNIMLDTVQVPSNSEGMPMPLYMSMKAKDFDKVIDRYPDAAVIISTIGFPSDVEHLKLLQNEDGPKVILLGLPSGPVSGLADLLRRGKVSAVVFSNPKARYDTPAPQDRDKAFDTRYVLVTKDNLDEYPSLFTE